MIRSLSESGKGAARRPAIRNSSDLEMLDRLLFGVDAAWTGAAKQGLLALPHKEMGPYLLEKFTSTEVPIQALAIEIVSARSDSGATEPLQAIAWQEGGANQKAAIRALGKVGDPKLFPTILQAYVAADGQALQKDWQAAVWDMSRRQLKYDLALKDIEAASQAPTTWAWNLPSLV